MHHSNIIIIAVKTRRKKWDEKQVAACCVTGSFLSCSNCARLFLFTVYQHVGDWSWFKGWAQWNRNANRYSQHASSLLSSSVASCCSKQKRKEKPRDLFLFLCVCCFFLGTVVKVTAVFSSLHCTRQSLACRTTNRRRRDERYGRLSSLLRTPPHWERRELCVCLWVQPPPQGSHLILYTHTHTHTHTCSTHTVQHTYGNYVKRRRVRSSYEIEGGLVSFSSCDDAERTLVH